MATIVIGVDLGKKTGIAILQDGRFISSYIKQLNNKTNGEDFCEFKDELQLIFDHQDFYSTDLYMFCEEPFYKRNVKTFGKLSGYEAIFLEFCARKSSIGLIEYYESINNQTIKSHFGVKSKSDMMAKAKELSGRDDLTQDEADAILVAFYGWEMIKKGGSK
ncbi:MAG: hypothetical protein ACTSRC_21890 [Candidatus Helarchaeota archaeon]